MFHRFLCQEQPGNCLGITLVCFSQVFRCGYILTTQQLWMDSSMPSFWPSHLGPEKQGLFTCDGTVMGRLDCTTQSAFVCPGGPWNFSWFLMKDLSRTSAAQQSQQWPNFIKFPETMVIPSMMDDHSLDPWWHHVSTMAQMNGPHDFCWSLCQGIYHDVIHIPPLSGIGIVKLLLLLGVHLLELHPHLWLKQ